MIKRIYVLGVLFFFALSCNNPSRSKEESTTKKTKTESIIKQHCSFDLTDKLYLDKIDDSSFSEEGYFKIASHESSNVLQLFVYDAPVDVNDKVTAQVEALNSPDIFTASSIDSVFQLGRYTGKGVNMKGTYEGGVIKGAIKIFSFTNDNKGFLLIRQTIDYNDTADFNLVERSLLLK